MQIAVIGVYYASNLGDAVICDCVAYLLRQAYPDAGIDIIDIEGKTAFPEQTRVSLRTLKRRKRKLQWDYWLTKKGIQDRVYYWNQIDVEKRQAFYEMVAAKSYDAVVFAGGQLFMDWLSVDICEFLKRFARKNTPVFFNACGAGLGISETTRKLLKQHLMQEHVRLVSTRDDAEKIQSRYLDYPKKVVSTYDPALWVKEAYPLCSRQKKKTAAIGLGVMYCENESIAEVTDFWIRMIRLLEKKQIKWKMFCNGAIEDYYLGVHILEKLRLNPAEYFYDYPKTPEALIEQINAFSALISFRLHSHIIAASLDIPAVSLVWDEKVRFFYRHLGYEERCKTIKDSPEDIFEALQKGREKGYNRSVIEEQKLYAKNLLLQTIHQELFYEQK